ncbi:MAG: Diadenosine 55-P1,P4-tetraphosphate pyrophosphohydrolase [Gemmatimonadetes bacterium]|nr:Diadenosine 55-P1,P4-tetraphosphate pyrophosphohydrolase [Gemmatimonadota bacterium]
MRRKTQRAAGIVLFRTADGVRRYLLVRSALTRRPIWEFPKGGVEAGESDPEAAERELREEAGLALGEYEVVEGFREEERYVFTQGSGAGRMLILKQVVYYLAEGRTERIEISHEAEEYRWVTFDEAQRLLRFPGKRHVLEQAEAFLDLAASAHARPADGA